MINAPKRRKQGDPDALCEVYRRRAFLLGIKPPVPDIKGGDIWMHNAIMALLYGQPLPPLPDEVKDDTN